jgi:hypothetical protein
VVVITVELWRKGDPNNKIELGSARITNTGGGTETKGNYIAAIFGKRGRHMETVSIAGFPRKRLMAWDLIFRALRAAFEQRNPKDRTCATKEIEMIVADLKDLRAHVAPHVSASVIDAKISAPIRYLERVKQDL